MLFRMTQSCHLPWHLFNRWKRSWLSLSVRLLKPTALSCCPLLFALPSSKLQAFELFQAKVTMLPSKLESSKDSFQASKILSEVSKRSSLESWLYFTKWTMGPSQQTCPSGQGPPLPLCTLSSLYYRYSSWSHRSCYLCLHQPLTLLKILNITSFPVIILENL